MKKVIIVAVTLSALMSCKKNCQCQFQATLQEREVNTTNWKSSTINGSFEGECFDNDNHTKWENDRFIRVYNPNSSYQDKYETISSASILNYTKVEVCK